MKPGAGPPKRPCGAGTGAQVKHPRVAQFAIKNTTDAHGGPAEANKLPDVCVAVRAPRATSPRMYCRAILATSPPSSGGRYRRGHLSGSSRGERRPPRAKAGIECLLKST